MPPVIGSFESAVAGDQPAHALYALGKIDNALAVGSCHHLSHRGLWPRWLSVHAIAEAAVGKQANDFALDIKLCRLIPDQRIIDAAAGNQLGNQIAG